MIKKFLLPLMIVISLVSCKGKDAFKYSQDFVKEEQAIAPEMMKTETAIAGFIAKEQFDSVVAVSSRMESRIQESISAFSSKPAPDAKEAENFKAAGIKYLNYIKNVYSVYIEYGKASTDDIRNEALVKMQDLVAKKSTVISDMQSAQKKFANANGFRIENK
ncbi:MAG: hypothetical protein EOP54_31330 [Sphingobacteriales bacterium]|nr:MAG: hypothetical protein EOP54_31330 [Sphingobacteriales bacterium]